MVLIVLSYWWLQGSSNGTDPQETRALKRQNSLYSYDSDGVSDLEEVISRRCRGTKGNLCINYWEQNPALAPRTPRGSQRCQNDCTGAGVCNADTGRCACMSGLILQISLVLIGFRTLQGKSAAQGFTFLMRGERSAFL